MPTSSRSQRQVRKDAGVEQSITVEIEASPERVWEVLADVERWSEWTETVTWVRRLDDGPLRSGSRAKINQPKLPETEYVVTEIEPGQSFTWVATGPGVTTTARHAVEALPGGGRAPDAPLRGALAAPRRAAPLRCHKRPPRSSLLAKILGSSPVAAAHWLGPVDVDPRAAPPVSWSERPDQPASPERGLKRTATPARSEGGWV